MGIITKVIGAILAGVGFYIVLMGLNPLPDDSMTFVYFIIGLVVMSVGFNLMVGSRREKEVKPPPPTITEIRCDSPECNFKEIRDFERGDYILRLVDVPCPKCGGSMTVEGIYVIREEPEQTFNV